MPLHRQLKIFGTCYPVMALLFFASRVAPAVAEEEKSDEYLGSPNAEEDRACAVMLLGSIGFMMGIFYLVNHHDKHFRFHAWRVVSSTISIFSAVLLFQAINGLVESYLVDDYGFQKKPVAFSQMIFWLFWLQLSLAHLTRAVDFFYICKKRSSKVADKGKGQPLLHDSDDEEDPLTVLQQHYSECAECGSWVVAREDAAEMNEETAEDKEENALESWSMLLGHMSGFATINAWGVLQQDYEDSVFHAFLVSVACYTFVRLITIIMWQMRRRLSMRDDGEMDDAEVEWNERSKETEDDVVGLAVSFLLVQTFRLYITGKLPNAEGEEEPEGRHDDKQAGKLMLLGILLMCIEIARTFSLPSLGRITAHAQNITSMAFAWCVLFSLQWYIDYHAGAAAIGMLKQVYIALITTVLSFCGIWIVQYLEDLDCTGDAADESLSRIILALAIGIGFAWEKCFDMAVTSIADATSRPAWSKVGLAVLLASVVIPAWRWFILPDVLEMAAALKQEDEEAKRNSGSVHHQDMTSSGRYQEPKKKKESRRASLVGLTQVQLQTRVMSTMLLKVKAKTEHDKQMRKLQKEHDKHKKRADINEANLSQMQSLLDAFSEEVQHVKILADTLENHQP